MKRLLVVGCAVAGSLLLVHHVSSERVAKDAKIKHVQRNIIVTESGLKYEILQEGTGASPKAGQRTTVHYTGWLQENGVKGKKFDSSVDRGQPFTFVVGIGQVIKGWDEGVMMMKEGEKRRLIIPSDLGYGARGAGGGLIPPHATLIFDVELIKVG